MARLYKDSLRDINRLRKLSFTLDQEEEFRVNKADLDLAREVRERIRRVTCVLCEKISKIPSGDGNEVINWAVFQQRPLDQIPDYS